VIYASLWWLEYKDPKFKEVARRVTRVSRHQVRLRFHLQSDLSMGFTGYLLQAPFILLHLNIPFSQTRSLDQCTYDWPRAHNRKHCSKSSCWSALLHIFADSLNSTHLDTQGQFRGKWQLSVRSFRSTLGASPGLQVQSERSMCALSMNENVFVLLEDPSAPTRADVLAMAPPDLAPSQVPGPTHYRTTFLTLKPPGALEQLLDQLRARWVPVRQTASSTSQKGQAMGQLNIDGNVFAIGNDWLVRVGNVILAGGAVKGMLLEVRILYPRSFLIHTNYLSRLSTCLYRCYTHKPPTAHQSFCLIF
jgi:hypothetical protein